MHNLIPVTKSFLPPLDEYVLYLREIWDSNQLTNNGPLVKQLEKQLKDYLGVKHLFFVSNGTIALQIAIKALGLQGEIITTPFSYVATTSSIVWEGCTPVFVDIDPQTLCINASLIESAVTSHTTGILATHVYGIPCNVEKIKRIADEQSLSVIYDAAHTFGVKYKTIDLVNYGDVSILSFHATKLFHTVEGGAIVTENDEIAHRLSYMRNFGHKGPVDFWGLGVNGKNSEFHAAMGLCNLTHITEILEKRKEVSNWYDVYLSDSGLLKPDLPDHTQYNYAYYPVIFNSEEVLLTVVEALNSKNIFPRRYFYPSLSELPYLPVQHMKISEDISKRILCLPMYTDLRKEDVLSISKIIINHI